VKYYKRGITAGKKAMAGIYYFSNNILKEKSYIC